MIEGMIRSFLGQVPAAQHLHEEDRIFFLTRDGRVSWMYAKAFCQELAPELTKEIQTTTKATSEPI